MLRKYDAMTTQELEEILRDEKIDEKTLLQILDVLSARKNNTEVSHVKHTWDIFCREYMSCKETLVLREKRDWRVLKRVLGTCAACLVLLTVTFGVLFTSVEAFRIAVTNMFIENTQGHWHISGGDLMPEEELPVVHRFDIEDPLCGLLDEDYSLTDITNADTRQITAVYKDSDGDTARFMCFPISTSLKIDSERAEVSKKVQVLDYDGILVVKKGNSQVAWWDNDSGLIYLLVVDNTTENEAHTLAERMAKIIDGKE